MSAPGSTLRAGTAAAVVSDFERFQVRERLDIAALLRTVMERHALVTVIYGGGGKFFVSALLAVRPRRDEIIIDLGPNEEANATMLASPRLMVSMNLDDIPVQFHAPGARATTFAGGAAFSLPFPEAVMRMQRREFYRLRIPPGENATCEIRREPSDPRPLLLPVHNISCGGIAMENWPDGQALETHRIYRNCRLNLGEEVHVVTDLEIVHSIDHVEIDGTRLRRCGARFVDMPGRVVTNIQRYVMQLERQLHADPEGTGET